MSVPLITNTSFAMASQTAAMPRMAPATMAIAAADEESGDGCLGHGVFFLSSDGEVGQVEVDREVVRR